MTTTLLVDNAHALIIGPQYAKDVVKEALSYFSKGYRFTGAFKSGHWDGRRSLMRKSGAFPSGLLERATYALEEENVPFEVKANRIRPQPGKPLRMNFKLRDYQRDAAFAAIQSERGIIHYATGSGKTEVAIALTAKLGLRTLFLVNSRDLAVQTLRRFKERLPDAKVGLFGAGSKQLKHITVAMMQSLRSWMRTDKEGARDQLGNFDVLFSDECHTAPASTYFPLIMAIPAYYRFGLSATPFKKGDEGAELKLIGATGPVIATLTPQESVEKGVSVPSFVTMLDWGDRNFHPKASTPASLFELDDKFYPHYAALMKEAIVRSDARNRAVVEAAKALAQSGRQTLVLVRIIEHGATLSSMLDVPFVHGGSEVADRKNALQALRDGSEHIIISSTIFDQGVDVPSLSGLVIAGGGKAQHIVVQRIGRGSRTAEGKQDLAVVDLYDTNSRWMFKHSRERLKAYKGVGADVEVVIC